MIKDVEAAVKAYPYSHNYTVWPGPNSNTFTAHVARAVPDLRLDLPPTAVSKDYILGGGIFCENAKQIRVSGFFVWAAWSDGG
jgi:hypothetical protein